MSSRLTFWPVAILAELPARPETGGMLSSKPRAEGDSAAETRAALRFGGEIPLWYNHQAAKTVAVGAVCVKEATKVATTNMALRCTYDGSRRME